MYLDWIIVYFYIFNLLCRFILKTLHLWKGSVSITRQGIVEF